MAYCLSCGQTATETYNGFCRKCFQDFELSDKKPHTMPRNKVKLHCDEKKQELLCPGIRDIKTETPEESLERG